MRGRRRGKDGDGPTLKSVAEERNRLEAVPDPVDPEQGPGVRDPEARTAGAAEDYPVDTEQRRNVDLLLRVNGFAAIRTELGGAINALRSVPPDAIEAVIDFLEHQRNRSEIKGKPAEMSDNMDAELRLFKAAELWRTELERLDAKTAARQHLRR